MSDIGNQPAPDGNRRSREDAESGYSFVFPADLARLSDAQLVALAAQGRSVAWNEIVRRFSGLIRAVTRRHRLSPRDAAEVEQFSWLQLYRHITRLREPERVAGWLATIARNECIRLIDRARREVAVDYVVETAAPVTTSSDPVEALLAGERRTAVRQAVRRLPERSQQLLRMLVWEGAEYDDIAEQLDMARGSVGPSRERVLRVLEHKPEIVRLAA